ncbi:MAG TPA: transposase, partial [Candidatus Limnocylindrales bacterium]|nr:transposase [Candidatus Limnocylindrales bacterium]
MGEFDKLFSNASDAFNHPKIASKVRKLAYGNLTCMGRHTISGMITSGGHQFLDWSSFYRLFSKQRVDLSRLNEVCIEGAIQELDNKRMIIAHMDDTIIKKTGRKIPGTSWRRDPLGPPFHTNFIWGQRFIQMSLAVPESQGACQSRAIPIGFHHCPTPNKPIKNATAEEISTYKEVKKQSKLSLQGALYIQGLRKTLDQQGHANRTLCMGVDGSYTNSTVLTSLPERTVLIGRIRKDTKLHRLPEHSNECKGAGRRKVYGQAIPTPEQVRQSPDYRWHEVEAWAAGKKHQFNVKIVKGLKWRAAGKNHTMQLMVIRPLAYRLNAHSRLLYRKPAYLICTDNDMSPEEMLQNYIWRWEIEVNIRDEKTLIGCGQAQVRNEYSAADVPAFVSAMYAFLILANIKAFKKNGDSKNRKILLPRPKWYPAKKEQRFTSGDLVNHLRTEMWAKALGCGNFSGFVADQHRTKSRSI